MKLEQLHKLWWSANGCINIYRTYCNIIFLFISSGDTSIHFGYPVYAFLFLKVTVAAAFYESQRSTLSAKKKSVLCYWIIFFILVSDGLRASKLTSNFHSWVNHPFKSSLRWIHAHLKFTGFWGKTNHYLYRMTVSVTFNKTEHYPSSVEREKKCS